MMTMAEPAPCSAQNVTTAPQSQSDSDSNSKASPFDVILHNKDLLRYVLSYLDISGLTGIFVAAARRQALAFAEAITVLHTGYYSPIVTTGDDIVTNESDFPLLFNSQLAFAPQVLSHLQTIVLFARETRDEGSRCPLSYTTCIQFMSRFCHSVESVHGLLPAVQQVALNLTKCSLASSSLLSQVHLSQACHSLVRGQVLGEGMHNLRYLLLETPFTGVRSGESALESLRTGCPLLERFDLLFTLSVEDFTTFVQPQTIWPSLKTLEIGKLIHAFVTRLELEDYFAESLDGQDDANDVICKVCEQLATVLTQHKFPKLQHLECFADSEVLYRLFAALIDRWVWRRPQHFLSTLGVWTADGDRDKERETAVFVGQQLDTVSIFDEYALGNVVNSDYYTDHLQLRWKALFDSSVMGAGAAMGVRGRHRTGLDYDERPLFDVDLVRSFCLFPRLKEVIFLPDLPAVQVMNLFNCAQHPPVPLAVRIQGQNGVCFAQFVQNVLRSDVWCLSGLEISPLRYCSVAVRRWILSRRVSFASSKQGKGCHERMTIMNAVERESDRTCESDDNEDSEELMTAVAEYKLNCLWPSDDSDDEQVRDHLHFDRNTSAVALSIALRDHQLVNVLRFATPLTLAAPGLAVMDELDCDWTECFAQLRMATLILNTVEITREIHHVIIRYLQRGAQRELPPQLETIALRVFTCRAWEHFHRNTGHFWSRGGVSAIEALRDRHVEVLVIYDQQSMRLVI